MAWPRVDVVDGGWDGVDCGVTVVEWLERVPDRFVSHQLYLVKQSYY